MTVLDTNVVIYLLEGRIEQALDLSASSVSVVTEIELLSFDRLDESGERAVRALLDTLQVVGLTNPIKRTAIDLRRRHGLTIPDAIIAAAAVELGAELLTNDAKLTGLPGIKARNVTLRMPREETRRP